MGVGFSTFGATFEIGDAFIIARLPGDFDCLGDKHKHAGDERANCGSKNRIAAVDDAKGRQKKCAGEEGGTIEGIEHVSCYL